MMTLTRLITVFALTLGMAPLSGAAAEIGSRLSSKTKLTGYYPHSSKMQGGYKNRYGGRLFTLEAFLAGKAPYVTVALDYVGSMGKFHKKYLCIPELDRAYASEMTSKVYARFGGRIPFKVMDTGGAFKNKRWKKMDICSGSRDDAWDKRLQQKVEIYDCDAIFKSKIKTKNSRE